MNHWLLQSYGPSEFLVTCLTWCKHIIVLHAKCLCIASCVSNSTCNGEHLQIMTTIGLVVYGPQIMTILLLIFGKHNNMSRTSQVIWQISQAKHITKVACEFYPSFTPKAYGESIFVPNHGRPYWRYRVVHQKPTPPSLYLWLKW